MQSSVKCYTLDQQFHHQTPHFIYENILKIDCNILIFVKKVRETINNDDEQKFFEDATERDPSTSEFDIGELIWGAARGHPAWPGKIVSAPPGATTPNDSTWVRWFGGRTNVEMVTIQSLKSLSEGLDAHHKAQKDTRK